MKKSTILGACVLALLVCAPASAITIDGDISDWGITPFQDWQVDLNGAHAQYTNNVVSMEHDGLHPAPSVQWNSNPAWDIEFGAMLAVQGEGLYFMFVNSHDQQSGYGDLAISIGDDVATQGGSAKYTYGVDMTHITTGTVQQRDVYSDVTNWKTSHGGYNFPDNPVQILNGNKMAGKATVASSYLGRTELTELNKSGLGKNYLLEGFIPFEMLGVSLLCDLPIEIHYAKVSCLRDWIRLTGTCTGPNCGTDVPEPTTMLLLGSALLGLGGLKKKKA